MMMYKRFFRPFLYRVSPETAHSLGMAAVKFLGLPGTAVGIRSYFSIRDPRLEVRLGQLTFPNPVGLAAGFDKNAQGTHVWSHLGFGFCEVGTITAYPQPGNPKPRIFRLQEDRALINRLGFNNEGAEAVARRLRKRYSRKGKPEIPLGINIGKSKVTPLPEAVEDYLISFTHLFPFADYFVVNVSSPNTPGLRDLQEKEALKRLLEALMNQAKHLSRTHERPEPPLLVKLSPDLPLGDLCTLARMVMEIGVTGFVLTNTTLARHDLRSVMAGEAGGLSGKPLRERATEIIRAVRSEVGGKAWIIGCGGIFSAEDARDKLRAGSNLVQIYTGLVYEGPTLPLAINQELLRSALAVQKA